MFNIRDLSRNFIVQRLKETDVAKILQIEEGNPAYFFHMKEAVSEKRILEDMKALPPHKEYKDKYYLGYWRNNDLVAVLDVVLGYPDKDTAYIGFFMMNKTYKRKHIGALIIKELIKTLKVQGFSRAELAYVKGNAESRGFWIHNEFREIGSPVPRENYTLMKMERILK